MKFDCKYQDDTEFSSEDMIEFNGVIKNKDVKTIDVDFGSEKITIDYDNGQILNNGIELVPLLSSIEKDIVGKIEPKIFRRTRVVVGATDEPSISSKYYVGWIGNGREQFVVFDGEEITTTDSR